MATPVRTGPGGDNVAPAVPPQDDSNTAPSGKHLSSEFSQALPPPLAVVNIRAHTSRPIR